MLEFMGAGRLGLSCYGALFHLGYGMRNILWLFDICVS